MKAMPRFTPATVSKTPTKATIAKEAKQAAKRKAIKQITALMNAMVKIYEAMDLLYGIEDRDLDTLLEGTLCSWNRFGGPTLTSKINYIADDNEISHDGLWDMYEEITAGDCGDWVY